MNPKKELEMALQKKILGEDYVIADFPLEHFIPTAFWRFFYFVKTGYQIENNNIYLPVFILLSDEYGDQTIKKVRNKDLFKFENNDSDLDNVESFSVQDSEDFSVSAGIKFQPERMKPKLIDENFKNLMIKKQILELP